LIDTQLMKCPAKLQRLYQIFPLLKLDTTKKRGVTLLYTISRGGFFLAKNTAGENPASFGLTGRLNQRAGPT
jgi:hypothetical protein